MSSCIFPIASIYMEHIEHTANTTFHTPPPLWLRYVEDTFCISHTSQLNMLAYSVHHKKKNTIFLSRFLTFWLNATVAMVASLRTVFYLPQFTENPHTLTDIFTTRHITSNIRSSLLPKLYSTGLILILQVTHRNTVNYRTYAVPCD